MDECACLSAGDTEAAAPNTLALMHVAVLVVALMVVLTAALVAVLVVVLVVVLLHVVPPVFTLVVALFTSFSSTIQEKLVCC